MKTIFDFAAPALAVAGLCLFGTGCVNRQLTESYHHYLNTVGTEYIQYVQADPALTGDDKAIRQENHDQAVKTVAKFQETKWSW